MLVFIVDKAINAPKKYEPPSPKKILAFGKLYLININNIIICKNNKYARTLFWLKKLIKNKFEIIINECNPNSPLYPSIKFAPLIINKKHNNTKKDEKILLCKKFDKKDMSIFKIFIGKKWIEKERKIIINNNLLDGLTLILISSNKPVKNIKLLIKMYSYKISE